MSIYQESQNWLEFDAENIEFRDTFGKINDTNSYVVIILIIKCYPDTDHELNKASKPHSIFRLFSKRRRQFIITCYEGCIRSGVSVIYWLRRDAKICIGICID